LGIGVNPEERLFFVIDDESVGYEYLWGFLGVDEFLPEIGARLDSLVVVAILVEHGIGLLLKGEHNWLGFLFHRLINSNNNRKQGYSLSHALSNHAKQNRRYCMIRNKQIS